jgi:hypothetical protein
VAAKLQLIQQWWLPIVNGWCQPFAAHAMATTQHNGEGICDKNANLCLNRHEYLFWDLFHPTMTASKLAALTLYAGEPRFVSPINFKQLAEA